MVLSCTNRKRVDPPMHMRLRDLPSGRDRAAAWIHRVESADLGTSADRLYAGEYWVSGSELRRHAQEWFDVEAWVISAGLGLVSAPALICTYAATLSPGHPDSVVQPTDTLSASEQRRSWWAALARWDGPAASGEPRSLAALAGRDPDANMIVCAGADYLDAVHEDLLATQHILRSSEQLLVFGSGGSPPGVGASWITVPGRLRTLLGGSMASTGVRAARRVIDGERLGAARAREVVGRLVESSTPLPIHERKKLNDAEIIEWTQSHLRDYGPWTKSVALREFRSAGLACEQSRFGRLFDVAVETSG